MATIAQIDFLNPVNLEVGTTPDIHRGIKSVQIRKIAAPKYRHVPEGSTRPTRSEAIETDQAPYVVSVTGKALNWITLSDTSDTTASLQGTDAADGSTVTITMTNPDFQDFQGGGSVTGGGDATLDIECTNVVIS